jgi:hypothetical protein
MTHRDATHPAPCGTSEFWAIRSCGADLKQTQLQRKGKNKNSVTLMETWLQTESEGNGIPGGSKCEVLITLQQEAGPATNLSTVQVMASLSPKQKRKFTLYVFVHIHYQQGTRWRSGWVTALQTGRSRFRFPMVSLDFVIDIILPVALWPWGRLSL